MSVFVLIYGVLFSLPLVSYECEGKITSPRDGTELTFLPGSTANITWTFEDDPPTVPTRSWFFTSSVDLKIELLGTLSSLGSQVAKNALPVFELIEPATLTLTNVSQIYDGTYLFSLKVGAKPEVASKVIVYIAKEPNVTINCTSRNEVNEGDDFTCVCRGEGGRPPANVTWSKVGKQIGGIGKENQTLTLSNVDGKASGTYECKAESYPSDEYIDEKSIVVEVNSKPYDTNITSTPGPIIEIGGSVVLTCKVYGFPIPSYNITYNVTKIVSINKTYTIEKVKWSDAGTYKCIARNKFGSDSDFANLTVIAEVQPATLPPTIPITTTTTTTTKGSQTDKVCSNNSSSGTEWYIVVVSLVSGIIIGILFSYIVSCSHRRWFKNRKPERTPEPQKPEVDTTYQELDLTKMNKEDNYQSLRVNVATNDEESTYAELNKTRDDENNYQSLT